MQYDPATNHILFDDGVQPRVQGVETRREDGVEAAWMAQVRQGAKASEINRVFLEWEPTETDKAFLGRMFPQAEFSFSFARPLGNEESDWEQAIAVALDTIEQAQKERAGQTEEAGEEEEAAQDGLADAILLLPVLRDEPSEEDAEAFELVTQGMFCQPHGAGLASVLADVQRKEDGAIGIHYLMRALVSEEVLAERMQEVTSNIVQHLVVEGGELQNGERLISVSHRLNHGSSVLTIPHFYKQASVWLECESVLVGIIDPNQVLIAAESSEAAVEHITRLVMSSNYFGEIPLTPATFRLTADGLERIESRPSWE